VNGQDDQCDDQHDVNQPANRFLQKNKTQQPEHQQHAPDNQEHLVAPMRFSLIYDAAMTLGAKAKGGRS
jgi:hypothetical protein